MKTPQQKRKRFQRLLIFCSVLYFFDGLFLGIPVFGLSIAAILIFKNLIQLLYKFYSDRNAMRYHAIVVGFYTITISAIIGTILLNHHIGRNNAEIIINAVELYVYENGIYPKTLDELVPDYIRKIPKCAIRIVNPDYRYIENVEQHTLLWEETPPYDRPYYIFEEKKWGYIG